MDGIDLIDYQRRRQIDEKGFDAEHDNTRSQGELALVAAILLGWHTTDHGLDCRVETSVNTPEWVAGAAIHIRRKYKDDGLAQLAIAGALVAAEIDRLQRAERRAMGVEVKTQVELAPGLPPLDAHQVETCLLLVGTVESMPTEEVIATWSQDLRERVFKWAMAIHLRASDNDDIEVPPMPDEIKPYVPADLHRNSSYGGYSNVT